MGYGVVTLLHDPNLAGAYADRICVLGAGEVVAEGPPEAVLTEALFATTFGLRVTMLRHPVTGRPVMLPGSPGAFNPERARAIYVRRNKGDFMFIAMNRFQVRRGREEEFERVWKERDSRLKDVPGFREFHLLRGAGEETFTLYSSHTVWASRADFEAWTQSQAFRDAHSSAGEHRHMYLDRPRFEGFDVVQHHK